MAAKLARTDAASIVTPEKLAEMSLSDIARLINREWHAMPAAARVYAGPMGTLRSINDSYGRDDGESIVARFLSNASTWRGPTARVVKAHLRKLAGLR